MDSPLVFGVSTLTQWRLQGWNEWCQIVVNFCIGLGHYFRWYGAWVHSIFVGLQHQSGFDSGRSRTTSCRWSSSSLWKMTQSGWNCHSMAGASLESYRCIDAATFEYRILDPRARWSVWCAGEECTWFQGALCLFWMRWQCFAGVLLVSAAARKCSFVDNCNKRIPGVWCNNLVLEKISNGVDAFGSSFSSIWVMFICNFGWSQHRHRGQQSKKKKGILSK